MRNWLGQNIEVGSVVYRGARDGNSSSFKIGVVESVNNEKPRVEWLWEDGYKWIKIGKDSVRIPCPVRPLGFSSRAIKGNPSLDSLVICDVDLAELKRVSVALTQDFDYSFTSVAEFEQFLTDFKV